MSIRVDEQSIQEFIEVATEAFRKWLDKLGMVSDLPDDLQQFIGVAIIDAVLARPAPGIDEIQPQPEPRAEKVVRSRRQRTKKRKVARPKPARRKKMSREDADRIREALGRFRKNSPKREEKRESIMRTGGFTRRQVTAAENGLERAKKRLKKKRRAKK